jgi:hypothetical protein
VLWQEQQQQWPVPQYEEQELLDGPQLPTPPPSQQEGLAGSSTDNPAQHPVPDSPPATPMPGEQNNAQTLTDPTVSSNVPGRKAGAPLTCAECSYTCKHKTEMRRHVDSVHHGIPRYRCDLCDIGVNDASSLSKHKKSAGHLRKLGQSSGQAALPAQRYGCRSCYGAGKKSQVFSRSDHLKRHLKSCRNCTLLGNGLPAGFKDGPRGMAYGLLKEGHDDVFAEGER